MAAMAAAIFGSIFNVTENRALGPAYRAVERGGVADPVRPHHDRLAASVGAARADGSGGKRGGAAGGVRDHLMLPPIQIPADYERRTAMLATRAPARRSPSSAP